MIIFAAQIAFVAFVINFVNICIFSASAIPSRFRVRNGFACGYFLNHYHRSIIMTAINNPLQKKKFQRAKIDRCAQLLFSWVESKEFLHLAQTINRCGEGVRLRVMRWETNLSTDAAVCDHAEIDSCFLLVFKRIRYDFYFLKIFPDRLPFAESIPFHVSFVVWR